MGLLTILITFLISGIIAAVYDILSYNKMLVENDLKINQYLT